MVWARKLTRHVSDVGGVIYIAAPGVKSIALPQYKLLRWLQTTEHDIISNPALHYHTIYL